MARWCNLDREAKTLFVVQTAAAIGAIVAGVAIGSNATTLSGGVGGTLIGLGLGTLLVTGFEMVEYYVRYIRG